MASLTKVLPCLALDHIQKAGNSAEGTTVSRAQIKNGDQAEVERSQEEETAHEHDAPDRDEERNDAGEQVIPLEQMNRAQLIDKVREAQDLADKNHDLFLRSQAEIENVKKRFQKDKEDLIKFSNESLIKELLPVLDNLEQAILHASNEDALDALREGVELTLKTLQDKLSKAGLVEVDSVGRPFDPNVHEAVSVEEAPDSEPNTVLHEVQKGYMLNKRLIRPAKVIVNKSRS
jgi:molecular chaperone GrpE